MTDPQSREPKPKGSEKSESNRINKSIGPMDPGSHPIHHRPHLIKHSRPLGPDLVLDRKPSGRNTRLLYVVLLILLGLRIANLLIQEHHWPEWTISGRAAAHDCRGKSSTSTPRKTWNSYPSSPADLKDLPANPLQPLVERLFPVSPICEDSIEIHRKSLAKQPEGQARPIGPDSSLDDTGSRDPRSKKATLVA